MRRRIFWLVVATTSVVVVSFVVPLCLLVRTIAQDRAMAAADQEARSLATLVTRIGQEPQLAEVVAGRDQRGVARSAVLTSGGRVLGEGQASATDPEVRRALDGEAFTVVDDTGGRVLLPVVTGDGTAVVRTTVSAADLRRGVTTAWAGIIGLGVLLLALAAGIAAWLGRRISEPLLDVAGVAHQLREGDLAARADVRGTEETEELARALNGLAERTTELLVEERLAVADLSHRLRTPVTALRLDAEAVRDPSLGPRLQDHVDVLRRTIDAIVREARRPVRTDLAARCEAVAVVRDRCDHWLALAEDQGRTTRVRLADGPLPVPLAADDLADLVDVLVDNVFAHTAEPTAFSVDLDRPGGEVRLRIEDQGVGPQPVAGERPGSTGLGLDIARRTAASCGGRLTAGPGPDGGFRVEVVLPLLDP
ncbi:ATP-binding protein [Nocardioides sp. GXQ0305]|uniref:sensor histidine kinase n=1 Tax=Nocardioides sp. GXQ0305 TaxID=3423912 RepID=UPI003D7E5274